jgi:hypothetical protein
VFRWRVGGAFGISNNECEQLKLISEIKDFDWGITHIFEELLDEKTSLQDLTGEPNEASNTCSQSCSLSHSSVSEDFCFHYSLASLKETRWTPFQGDMPKWVLYKAGEMW